MYSFGASSGIVSNTAVFENCIFTSPYGNVTNGIVRNCHSSIGALIDNQIFLRFGNAPASNTASGSAGQVAWTNADGTNWFLYFDPNGIGPGTSAWVRIQGGASW
jgi:hypothetical protein